MNESSFHFLQEQEKITFDKYVRTLLEVWTVTAIDCIPLLEITDASRLVGDPVTVIPVRCKLITIRMKEFFKITIQYFQNTLIHARIWQQDRLLTLI